MKAYLVVLSSLLLLPQSLAAQLACRQAPATAAEHHQGFTIFTVSLPSPTRPFLAKALIPDSAAPAGAFVFSLSELVGSEPVGRVEMMPVAIELGRKGRPLIVVERELTWPEVAQSVGHLQQHVLCAEQWLAGHAAVRPDDWVFVGPRADLPTFEQLHAVGDSATMTFNWNFPLGVFGDYQNTENALRKGSLAAAQLTDFHEDSQFGATGR